MLVLLSGHDNAPSHLGNLFVRAQETTLIDTRDFHCVSLETKTIQGFTASSENHWNSTKCV